MTRMRLAATVPALFVLAATPGHAQGLTVISFVGGVTSYDLSGTGTTGFGGIRFELGALRWLLVEPGATVARYETSVGEDVSFLLPELSFQLQVPSAAVRPYIGGGIGFVEFLSGPSRSDVTLHVAGGLRVDLGSAWGIGGDVRLRSIDPFKGSTFDVGVSLRRRL